MVLWWCLEVFCGFMMVFEATAREAFSFASDSTEVYSTFLGGQLIHFGFVGLLPLLPVEKEV